MKKTVLRFFLEDKFLKIHEINFARSTMAFATRGNCQKKKPKNFFLPFRRDIIWIKNSSKHNYVCVILIQSLLFWKWIKPQKLLTGRFTVAYEGSHILFILPSPSLRLAKLAKYCISLSISHIYARTHIQSIILNTLPPPLGFNWLPPPPLAQK